MRSTQKFASDLYRNVKEYHNPDGYTESSIIDQQPSIVLFKKEAGMQYCAQQRYATTTSRVDQFNAAPWGQTVMLDRKTHGLCILFPLNSPFDSAIISQFILS